MRSKEWTEEEDNLLKEIYPLYGIEYCLTKLDRTKRAIQLRRVKLHIPTQQQTKPKYYKDNLEKIVKEAKTYRGCLVKLGIKNFGSSYNTLKKYIDKYDLDISHFENDISDWNFSNRIPTEDILVEDSTYSSRTSLKKRLYKEGLKERICELCGQDEMWKGTKISLILDHINGINNDNRIENLRIVCPNCNAGLPTHCRGTKVIKKYHCECGEEKSKRANKCIKCRDVSRVGPRIDQRKVKDRPSHSQLLQDIKDTNYIQTGKKYNVSDNAIRKWIKSYEKDGIN